MNRLIIVVVFIDLFVGCRSQNSDQMIRETANHIVNAILTDNKSTFISLIGVTDLRIMGKNEEMVESDIKNYYQLFKEYDITENKPRIEITGLYNKLGQKLVKVQIFSNKGNHGIIDEVHLALLFGPPKIVDLTKISGYMLVKNNSDSLDFHPTNYWNK
jgi:hypothetical protein